MAHHEYTPEQKQFLTNNVIRKCSTELTEVFNKRFGLDLKVSQIRAYMKNHGLKNGLNTRFKPGQVPFNKGKKGVGGWGPTQFKKGNIPKNYMPVGRERINGNGYVDIKVADPNKWRGKHILIWEEHNGSVPKGHAVIFGDGNNRNFDINNLIIISRKQLLIMNRKHLIKNDVNFTRTGIIIANLYQKIVDKKTKLNNKQ